MKRAASSLLFGLAPDGVYHAIDITIEAVSSYLTISPLPPLREGRRYIFCGTFHRVSPPGCYPASCPVEPGLSSSPKEGDHLSPTSGTFCGSSGFFSIDCKISQLISSFVELSFHKLNLE